jgi:hypothetical protein
MDLWHPQLRGSHLYIQIKRPLNTILPPKWSYWKCPSYVCYTGALPGTHTNTLIIWPYYRHFVPSVSHCAAELLYNVAPESYQTYRTGYREILYLPCNGIPPHPPLITLFSVWGSWLSWRRVFWNVADCNLTNGGTCCLLQARGDLISWIMSRRVCGAFRNRSFTIRRTLVPFFI